jgi:hypothetical protein
LIIDGGDIYRDGVNIAAPNQTASAYRTTSTGK